MLLTALIGWTIVLPIVVVAGLYGAARVLGARARRRGGLEEEGLVGELEGLTISEARRDRVAVESIATEPQDRLKLGA